MSLMCFKFKCYQGRAEMTFMLISQRMLSDRYKKNDEMLRACTKNLMWNGLWLFIILKVYAFFSASVNYRNLSILREAHTFSLTLSASSTLQCSRFQ